MKTKNARKQIVRKFYDDFAEDYDESRYSTDKQKLIDISAKTVVLDLLGNIEGKSILDCGCGTGRFADIFVRSGANATGVDISENMLNIAKRKVPGAKFIKGDVFSLPFKEEEFDMVVCSQVLTHLHKYKEPLLEMKRAMREDGTIIIDIRNILWPLRPLQILKQKIIKNNEYNPHFTHIRNIKKICGEIGLEIEEFRGINFHFKKNKYSKGYYNKTEKICRYFAPTLILKMKNKELTKLIDKEKMKPKICFYALTTYPLLSQPDLGFIGGAELQQVLIGKELTKNGYDVSFVVFDHGQEPFEIIDGIKIYKTVPKGYVLSGVRSLYHAFKSVWSALKQADADIYYQMCAARGRDTGFVALFCLFKKKKFIYSIANDDAAEGKYIKTLKQYERILYNFGIKKADCIIAQSEYQQEVLKKNFNQDSIIIKSAYPIEKVEKSKSEPPIVLWVGTIKPEWKQPELFLELAKKIPDATFQMVGGASTDKQFYGRIKEEAERIPNLEFVGFVPYPDVNKYFANASILVNTSSVEGFSNTFLQAWAAYTPVVSLNADPDGIICKYKLGFHSKTFSNMVIDVKTLLQDEKLREEMGMNGRRYMEREHDIKKIVRRYAKVFGQLLQ